MSSNYICCVTEFYFVTILTDEKANTNDLEENTNLVLATGALFMYTSNLQPTILTYFIMYTYSKITVLRLHFKQTRVHSVPITTINQLQKYPR